MSWQRVASVIALIALAIALSGCSSAEMTYVAAGGTYTGVTVGELATTIDEPSFAGASAEQAEDLRHNQLADLRSQGDSQATLADILTEDFPSTSTSAPYYAEAAVVDDRDTWVVLEMWGSPGGTLDRQRLWVLERESGEIVLSMVFN